MFSFTSQGDYKSTTDWLQRLSKGDIFNSLSKYGDMGVAALSSATPKETGETAGAWTYEIIQDATSWSIVWSNTNVVEGQLIAVLLQLGHGTGTGGYVEGQDYINPAMRPIFDQMVSEGWKVVMA